MEPRTVDRILPAWRERESQVDKDPNADVEALHTRIAELRDHHTGAFDGRQHEADELRRSWA